MTEEEPKQASRKKLKPSGKERPRSLRTGASTEGTVPGFRPYR
jgi:hypothetical protein